MANQVISLDSVMGKSVTWVNPDLETTINILLFSGLSAFKPFTLMLLYLTVLSSARCSFTEKPPYYLVPLSER